MQGYELHKTGARVKELLERQFVVPTLDAPPTSETTTWQDGEYLVDFRIGEMCRVNVGGVYRFFQLVDISEGVATWKEDSTGGVEIVTEERYEELKESSQLIANVIYLVMGANDPIALYIGTILIAQREEGQKGFTYNFPIIF